jgi:hypothetical protein
VSFISRTSLGMFLFQDVICVLILDFILSCLLFAVNEMKGLQNNLNTICTGGAGDMCIHKYTTICQKVVVYYNL